MQALKEDHSIPDEHCGELLLLVNSQQAGRIVGKGGEKLKAIRLVSTTDNNYLVLPVLSLSLHSSSAGMFFKKY